MSFHTHINEERTWGYTTCETCLNTVEFTDCDPAAVEWKQLAHKCTWPGGLWIGQADYAAVLLNATAVVIRALPRGTREPLTARAVVNVQEAAAEFLGGHLATPRPEEPPMPV